VGSPEVGGADEAPIEEEINLDADPRSPEAGSPPASGDPVAALVERVRETNPNFGVSERQLTDYQFETSLSSVRLSDQEDDLGIDRVNEELNQLDAAILAAQEKRHRDYGINQAEDRRDVARFQEIVSYRRMLAEVWRLKTRKNRGQELTQPEPEVVRSGEQIDPVQTLQNFRATLVFMLEDSDSAETLQERYTEFLAEALPVLQEIDQTLAPKDPVRFRQRLRAQMDYKVARDAINRRLRS